MINKFAKLLAEAEKLPNAERCAVCETPATGRHDCRACLRERTARYLIDHGAVLPPVAVGQTVYMPWEWNGAKGIAKLAVTHIIVNENGAFVRTDFNTDDEAYYEAYNRECFKFEDFGSIVFVIREEAEGVQK